jgi:hypothetical protein
MVLSTYVSTWHKNPELQQKVIQFEAWEYLHFVVGQTDYHTDICIL